MAEEFGNLNKHLIASIYPVDRGGNPKIDLGTNATGSIKDGEVRAMVTEATMEVSLGWQSPFEQWGPEATSPTLMALVQSGTLDDLKNLIGGFFDGWLGGIIDKITDPGDWASLVNEGVGRTGMTKMNSTQVFTGMPPIKINATLLFRAWSNPKTEVEAPFDTLMGWALPQCLQRDSILSGLLNGDAPKCPGADGSAFDIARFLPSLTPKMVGLTYKGRTYSPLVIESVGFPMDSPSTADGRYVELLVPVTFATWQVYDANDWSNVRTVAL
ncbi:hypothetical protein [Imhoffiella purpurea]|uniref:Uncharacterized protein n=1 Tax=Imhoffiella purpurea TaxID=1249627 RepID=W9VFS1_9GAMM|nr:hypothetical protein [Imhoffiella purpurea]EXJ14872.1 hypothetical protein D779_2078 [Imhoffiella purpurea]